MGFGRKLGGSAPWSNPLVAVTGTPAVGDTVLASSASAASWAPPTSLAFVENFSLNGTYGDEFSAASLNGKWTRNGTDPTTNALFQQGGGSWFTVGGVVAGGPTRYYETAPAGDFTVIASMWTHLMSGMVGIFIVDNTGAGFGISPYTGGSAWMWGMTAYAYSASSASLNCDLTGDLAQKYWVRLRKVGTTYYGSVSKDGVFWAVEQNLTNAFTVASLGFGNMFTTQVNWGIDRINIV